MDNLLKQSDRLGRVARSVLAVCAALALPLAPATPALAQESWLVWTAPGKGLGQTQLLEMTAMGPQIAASGAGFVAAHGSRVWSVRAVTVQLPVIACGCLTASERDSYNPDKPPPRCVSKKPFQSLQLVDALSGKARLLAPAPAYLSAEEGEPSWRVELLGQVGQYMLAAEYTWESPCMAAHGGAAAAFIALDLASGKAVELWGKAEHDQLVRAGRDKALAAIREALKKGGEDGRMVDEMADTLSVQAVSPAWDAAGRLQPRWLYVVGWDYASGDGVWGSYSRSAWVQIAEKLKRFANQPLLPLPVRLHLAAQAKADPPPRRFGWSAVQEAQIALAKAALAGKGPEPELEKSAPKAKRKVQEPVGSGRAPGAATGQRAPGGRASGGARATPGSSGSGSGRAGR